MAYPHGKYRERCENRNWRLRRKEGNMTEPIAMTIRHMKIEDYPLVYGLWTRCTGFTMRDIDDCEDAIKTFLKRNPDTCFVTEDDDGRIIGAILAGNDGRRSRIYTRRSTPTHAVGALARCWWAVWLKRFVQSVCRKSLSECPQTTMPATISGNGRALQSVTIWFIENCRCNNEPSTMPCTSPSPRCSRTASRSRPACRPTHGHVGSGGDAAAQRVHYVAQQPRVKRPLP